MIISLTTSSYASFTAVVAALGLPIRAFYTHNPGTGFMFTAAILFQDSSAALNVTFGVGTVATAAFTTDFPAAIEAAVTIS